VIRLTMRPRSDLVCQQAVELVTDYLEGVLPRSQRRRFEAHLAGCPDCPEYLAQMRAIIALAGSITPDDLAPHIRSDLAGLYRRWQADDSRGARTSPWDFGLGER
jgi:anti-sigma factor RsiW